jgi:hypothetical protein
MFIAREQGVLYTLQYAGSLFDPVAAIKETLPPELSSGY